MKAKIGGYEAEVALFVTHGRNYLGRDDVFPHVTVYFKDKNDPLLEALPDMEYIYYEGPTMLLSGVASGKEGHGVVYLEDIEDGVGDEGWIVATLTGRVLFE